MNHGSSSSDPGEGRILFLPKSLQPNWQKFIGDTAANIHYPQAPS